MDTSQDENLEGWYKMMNEDNEIRTNGEENDFGHMLHELEQLNDFFLYYKAMIERQ